MSGLIEMITTLVLLALGVGGTLLWTDRRARKKGADRLQEKANEADRKRAEDVRRRAADARRDGLRDDDDGYRD